MAQYIESNLDKIAIEEVAVKDCLRDFSSLNESHIDKVAISKPVIFAEIAPQRYNLIDGHHRMEKARRTGISRVQAYRLNVEQHIHFLTSNYEEYIEYWNSKLKSGY